jgi:hypothetical protein
MKILLNLENWHLIIVVGEVYITHQMQRVSINYSIINIFLQD